MYFELDMPVIMLEVHPNGRGCSIYNDLIQISRLVEAICFGQKVSTSMTSRRNHKTRRTIRHTTDGDGVVGALLESDPQRHAEDDAFVAVGLLQPNGLTTVH